ncbi:hypothetical protein [Micromonospora sp. NPDC023737]|uniref:hypothetical protein n=1 Tax=unclassified Micromonospora TaxID=2617518 RepID=UPI003400326E
MFAKAHADNVDNPNFGMPLPDGSIGRVVPTLPVDAVWHSVLQHTVPYAAACEQIAGGHQLSTVEKDSRILVT